PGGRRTAPRHPCRLPDDPPLPGLRRRGADRSAHLGLPPPAAGEEHRFCDASDRVRGARTQVRGGDAVREALGDDGSEAVHRSEQGDPEAVRADLSELLERARFEVIPMSGIAEEVEAELLPGSVLTVTCSPRKGPDVTMDLAERFASAG